MYAITAENISKIYRFYRKPVHRLLEALLRRPMHKPFTALEGVCFDVRAGSTLGIIGENGAGKSTLLKILAKTLSPSSGKIAINGKVAALLELGAGFHQEFTGRQNIFLNASLLGLSEKDIQDKEEEIIEFAELAEFIDRPLKTYSSGMVVRLAFSIATCVDPDILIVDEALSVGDVRFQQKCIRKMVSFRESGKTLIFCSHSMYQVCELCSKAIWLDKGAVKAHAETNEVVSQFMNFLEAKGSAQNKALEQSFETTHHKEADIVKVKVLDARGIEPEIISELGSLTIRIFTKCGKMNLKGHVGAALFDLHDQMVFGTSTKHSGYGPLNLTGEQCFEVNLNKLPVKRGSFVFKAFILDEDCLRVIDERSTRPFSFFSDRPDLGFLSIENKWVILGPKEDVKDARE